jgi:predicted ABC-type ATPase
MYAASRKFSGENGVPPKSLKEPDKPVLWIVAGPNGSGKSSLCGQSDIEGWGGSVWIINPDLLTVKISDGEGLVQDVANLQAVERIERWLESSIDAYQTIGVETVLSSPKYRRLVDLAQLRGFEVRMIYVLVKSEAHQIARIRQRVKDGGHDVPAEKVRSRRKRSFEQLCWFLGRVDQCFVFDNSTSEPKLMAKLTAPGELRIFEHVPLDFEAIMASGGVELIGDRPKKRNFRVRRRARRRPRRAGT